MRAGCVLTFMTALFAASAAADDSVVNSKHDLSAFGPGPVRATEESRVCVFCHTPHNASPQAPLWNRHNPTSYYRIYRSRTTDARVDQPGASSKLCLSCHDGSIALGLTLDRPADDPIEMNITYMPSGPSDLTNDLSDDHPIGFRFDRALSNRDPQLREPELVDHRIALGERGELECLACHEPHNNELGNFLRITERQGALCNACHDMNGWRLSAHANSPRTVPATATGGERLEYRSLADLACRACHTSHGAPHRERLLRDRPSQLCLNCHDGIGGADVLAVVNQRSGHRINTFVEHIRPADRRPGVAHAVECTDCHNPHAATASPAAQTLSKAGLAPLVPPAMKAVAGVSLSGQPVERARYYYEVCFQCHSERPAILAIRIPRQRDTGGNIRRQFLPTAASAHPVTFPARGGDETPSLLPSLRGRRFISCQDCHNNPDSRAAGGSLPNGPHGSRYENLLVRRYETRDFTIESPQAYALCYECHDRNSILGDESFPLHSRHIVRGRTPCSACHAPHGVNGSAAEHDHLINFDISIVQGRRIYRDTGRFSGSCTLTCHNVEHVNFTYSR
ncbi:MAG: hypothetical protein D6744_10215 [Planctomycetota bacterium]|nr:MAG: hypothetical protein D6744_10215 [Planctomycetota bacterium]